MYPVDFDGDGFFCCREDAINFLEVWAGATKQERVFIRRGVMYEVKKVRGEQLWGIWRTFGGVMDRLGALDLHFMIDAFACMGF